MFFASFKPQQEAKGAFSYTSPEGENIALTYIADELGFQPTGDVSCQNNLKTKQKLIILFFSFN
jgi:Insect cuticle protein